MVGRDELVGVDLDDDERDLLWTALRDWGGPAYGTEALARACGFGSPDELYDTAAALADALRDKRPLPVADWTRVLKVPFDHDAIPG